jgi:uncharacterized phage protein gp47/JayE
MTDLAEFTELFSETLARVRARLDADANAGLTDDMPAWIDIREGGFYWDVTQPPAMEMARLWDAMTETAAAAFPSTAWGDYLDEHGLTFNLTRDPAVAALGSLVFVATAVVLIAAGTQASSTASQTGDVITFQTLESGTTCAQLLTPSNVVATAAATGGTLTAATRYYHVTALNEFGETVGSQDKAAVTSSNTGRNTITWNPVAGASSYQVYVTQVQATLGFLVGSTVATTFIDDGTINPSDPEPTLNTTSGVTLASGAVTAGTAGNVAAGAVTALNTVIPQVYSVNNPDPFQGGQEEESDDDFRDRILGQYQGTSGGGNQADYRRWCVGQGVERVAVVPVWDGPGTVLVIIMQTDGSPVLASLVTTIQSFLDPVAGQGSGQAPIGATVTVTTSTVLPIDITCEVIPKPGYSLDGTGATIAYRTAILTALSNYLGSLDPGDSVVFEHIQACFFVPGVQDISGTVVNGITSGSIPLASGTQPQVARLGTINFTEP